MTAVGVDACKKGWIAIALHHGRAPAGHFLSSLDALLDEMPDAEGIAIDIPIGLPARGRRQADIEARRALGPRGRSVFFTPVRPALTAATHAEATAVSRELTGKGVSQQAYRLAPKILEAECWSATHDIPVWEVHPELSFTMLLGRPALAPKSTWSGVRERQRALEAAGITLDEVGEAGEHAGADDVLDAAAAAWSAARLVRGKGVCLPDPPETVPGTSRPMAIWA